jgi:hypothetical protein
VGAEQAHLERDVHAALPVAVGAQGLAAVLVGIAVEAHLRHHCGPASGRAGTAQTQQRCQLAEQALPQQNGAGGAHPDAAAPVCGVKVGREGERLGAGRGLGRAVQLIRTWEVLAAPCSSIR